MMSTKIRLDERYLEKDEFTEFVDTKFKRSVNSIINTVNNNYNMMVDWQKKSLIIGFIISLIIIFSMATSIIVSFNYMNKLNETITSLIELNEVQAKEIDSLQSSVDSLTKAVSELNTIDEEIKEIDEEVQEIEEEITPIVYNTTDISHKSGYSEEQFQSIIDNVFTSMNKQKTSMTTIADSLYKVEQEYDVNGLYLLGIASLESGWGTSGLATKSNNLYGLIGRKFNSVDECTEYMGSWIRSTYIDKGYDTLAKIQTKYCPNGGTKWINDVTWCTNKYISAAKELYPQQ